MADLAAVLVECRERLTESLADCCADDLAPGEADELLLEAIAVEQLGHAAVLALVRRAMVGEPWRRAGDRSARHHVARRCGVSVFRATQVLETAAQLDDLHEVATAVRSGALSSKVTQLAAATATLAPDRQADILQSARSEPWVAFKLACDRIRVAADTRSDAERHDAARRSRRCTARTTPDGMFELTWSDATTAGAELWALLQPFIDRRYQLLRQERPDDGDRPSAEAIVADALLDMARAASAVPEGRERPGAPSPPASGAKAKVIVHIDYRAWLHGAVTGDERCEIEGLGPIPVAAVRDLVDDAFVAAVIRDGTDIRQVVHLGRQPTALQRTYLQARYPTCAVTGCPNTVQLEIDHTVEWAETHHTTVTELCRLCGQHHDLKTFHGYTLRTDPDGTTSMRPPEHPPAGRRADRQAKARRQRQEHRDASGGHSRCSTAILDN